MRSWNPTPQPKEKAPQVHGVFCFRGMSNQARCPEGLDGIFRAGDGAFVGMQWTIGRTDSSCKRKC